MPLIQRCPAIVCGKFMLLEDDARGERVVCPCCRQPFDVPIELEAADEPQDEAAGVPMAETVALPTRRCPKCRHPISAPSERGRRAVSCTNCDFWGIVD
ncbi:MAG TPA: hypothetical protein DCQ98_17880 [Planctomycetaceae bacterium]|nr:hypothetical protein [Planctomycetaceae bacterium]HRE99473.1 hypothetical protein [Pirellulaceae bacterium]